MLNSVPVSFFNDKNCHLVRWMELGIQNCIFAHNWPPGKPWPLTVGPQIFRNAQHCHNKSFWLTKVPIWYMWMGLCLQNCSFDHIWSCGDHTLSPLNLKFSEMLNTAPISLFNWGKFLPVTSKWSYSSKTEFLPIFGHVVTLILDLKFSEMLNTAPIYLFHG